jgi:hypothetical protein
MRTRTSPARHTLVSISSALVLAGLGAGCSGADAVPEGDRPEAVANEESALITRWWTCTAHGREEAGIWAHTTGYGPDYASARSAALGQCARVASGCMIDDCHPGL